MNKSIRLSQEINCTLQNITDFSQKFNVTDADEYMLVMVNSDRGSYNLRYVHVHRHGAVTV